MARSKASLLNYKGMGKELEASDTAIDALLVSAKVTTINVDGKDVPAADAPLPAKISAIGKLISSGNPTEDTAELIRANGEQAALVTELEGKLTVAQSTISAQTQKIAELEGKYNTAQASVTKLTAEAGTSANLLKAATDEVTRTTGMLNAQKTALANRCIAASCLSLTGEDGKPLAESATADEKLSAALKLSHDDLWKSYSGAVNAAVAKTGVTFSDIPAPKPSDKADKQEPKGRERFRASAKVQGFSTK